jgi:cytochrome c5
MKALLVSVFLGLLLFSGCYYDSKEYLYPTLNTVCTDTISPVVYDGAISKILSDNCVSCHSTSHNYGSVILDSYANVKLVDKTILLGSILHTGVYTGSKAMPQGGSLSDCSTKAIEIWLNNNSPQK